MTHERLLSHAAQLFAARGYAGVSMREIAREVGITQATVYHHFTSKDSLYLAAVSRAFAQQTLGVQEQIEAAGSAADRLSGIVRKAVANMQADSTFRRIYLRELLDADEQRLKELAHLVFSSLHAPLRALMHELAPHADAELLIISLSALIFHHLEALAIMPYFPGEKSKNLTASRLADHITQLFLHGVAAP